MSVYPVYGGFLSHRATIYGGYPQFSSRWGFSPETIQLLGYPSFAQPGGDDGDDHDEDRDVDGHQADLNHADHQITYALKGLASFELNPIVEPACAGPGGRTRGALELISSSRCTTGRLEIPQRY